MLQTLQLTCLKGDRLLFRDLEFNAQAGDMWRIAGPNGAGKTSLMHLLCGLSLPEWGEVHWQGQNIQRQRSQYHQDLLYLAHAPALNDLLTPLENLTFTCAANGLCVTRALCEKALVRVGLKHQIHLPSRFLSQGQRRRISLARLFLAEHKKLWIVDEPFTALDAGAVNDIAGQLDQHCQAGGIVILTTHQEAPFHTAFKSLSLGQLC